MTGDDRQARKLRVADRKLLRDAAESVFRLVQMWIVLALVLYLQRQSGATLATVVMLVLSGALFIYTYVTPMYLLEEWSIARGRDVPGLAYLAALLATVCAVFPLLFADPIVDAMNAMMHARPAR